MFLRPSRTAPQKSLLPGLVMQDYGNDLPIGLTLTNDSTQSGAAILTGGFDVTKWQATGELVKAIQSQINDQISRLAGSEATLCQASLSLGVAGRPDAHCYVDAPHDERFVDRVKDIT